MKEISVVIACNLVRNVTPSGFQKQRRRQIAGNQQYCRYRRRSCSRSGKYLNEHSVDSMTLHSCAKNNKNNNNNINNINKNCGGINQIPYKQLLARRFVCHFVCHAGWPLARSLGDVFRCWMNCTDRQIADRAAHLAPVHVPAHLGVRKALSMVCTSV